MVLPHLEYGNAIWGPIYLGDLKQIEGVQRCATKLIPELKHLSYEDRLAEITINGILCVKYIIIIIYGSTPAR